MIQISKLQQHWQEKRPYLSKMAYIDLCLQCEFGEDYLGILIKGFDPSHFAESISIEKDKTNSSDKTRELIITKWDVVRLIATLGDRNLLRDRSLEDDEQTIQLSLDLRVETEAENDTPQLRRVV